jgi:hypothetical protein
MNAEARGDRRGRWERLARLVSQSQQRQQVGASGSVPAHRFVRSAAEFPPGWTGQSIPAGPAVLPEET